VSDGKVYPNRQLFQTWLLFALLQMVAPPGQPRAISITEALCRALMLGYRNRGIYARNGATLSLLLYSPVPGCLAGSNRSSGHPPKSFSATVGPEIHALIEFVLSCLDMSNPFSDGKRCGWTPGRDLRVTAWPVHVSNLYSFHRMPPVTTQREERGKAPGDDGSRESTLSTLPRMRLPLRHKIGSKWLCCSRWPCPECAAF
jgi:hypothetical protein